MDPITQSALIGTAGSLAQTGGNFFSEWLFGKRNQKWTQDNMKLSAELMRDQYDYEREKESPENERRRLEAAGLSPALLYGQGGSPGMASSISSMSAPGASSSGVAPFGNIAKSFSDAALARAQIDNLDQNTAKQKTETDYLRESQSLRLDILASQALSEKFEAQIKQIDALYRGEITRETLNKIRTEMDVMVRTLRNAQNLTEIEKQRVQGYLKSVTGQIALWNEQIKTEGTIQAFNEERTKDMDETRPSRIYKANAEGFRASNQADESNVRYRIMQELATDDRFHNAILGRMEAQVESLKSSSNLNNENAKYVYAYMLIRAFEAGGNTFKVISSEGREWARYFLDKSKQEGPMATLMDLAGDDMSFEDIKEIVSLFANFAK